MRTRAVTRIMWKEVRQMLAFFIAMVLLATVLQLMLTWTIKSSGMGWLDAPHNAFIVVGGFAALFAAACGATLFATDREMGTRVFLQTLPLGSGKLATGKLIGVGGLCFVFLLLAVIVSLVSIRLGDVRFAYSTGYLVPNWLLLFLGTFGLAVVEFFAWALLFSLLWSRPLLAAIAGILCASVSIQIAVNLAVGSVFDYSAAPPYFEAWRTRVLFILPVVIVDAWLAIGWLHGNEAVKRLRTATSVRGLSSLMGWIKGQSRAASRLLWQSWCELRWSIPVYVALFASCLIIALSNPQAFAIWGLAASMLSAGLLGLMAFSPEHRHNGFRFLASRGERPALAWLSRLLVPTLTILLIHAVALSIILVLALTRSRWEVATPFQWMFEQLAIETGIYSELNPLTMLFGYLTLGSVFCLAIGQAASATIRSRILALFFTMFLSVPVVFWLLLIMVAKVPLWWNVVPVGLALAVAGWLALKALFAERSAWHRIGLPAGLVLVTFVYSLLGTTLYRVSQVPEMGVGFSRSGSPDMAVLESVRRQFSEALTDVQRPGKLPGNITALHWGILQHERDPERRHPAHWFEDVTDVLWLNQEQIRELVQLSAEYLADNQQQLEQCRAAIQRAYDNIDQFEQMVPRHPGDGRGELILPSDGSPLDELLWMSFEAKVVEGRAAEAWQDLKSRTQFLQLRGIERPEDLYWLGRDLLTQFERWTVCENQTPELLEEAIEFIARQLYSPRNHTDRVMEYAYLELHQNLLDRNPEVPRRPSTLQAVADNVRTALWQFVPSERERSRRMLNLYTNRQLTDIGANALPPLKELTTTRIYGTPMYQLRSTTIWPLGFGGWSKIFAELVNHHRHRDRVPSAFDALVREQRDMLILSLGARLCKLRYGKYPETLEELNCFLQWSGVYHGNYGPNRYSSYDYPFYGYSSYDYTLYVWAEREKTIAVPRYHYFPRGLDNWLDNPNGQSLLNRNIPPGTPFISNRNPLDSYEGGYALPVTEPRHQRAIWANPQPHVMRLEAEQK